MQIGETAHIAVVSRHLAIGIGLVPGHGDIFCGRNRSICVQNADGAAPIVRRITIEDGIRYCKLGTIFKLDRTALASRKVAAEFRIRNVNRFGVDQMKRTAALAVPVIFKAGAGNGDELVFNGSYLVFVVGDGTAETVRSVAAENRIFNGKR